MWGLAHAGFCRTTSKCRKTKVASTMSNEECVCGTSHGGFNRTGSIHSIPRVGTVLWGGSTVSIKLLAGAGLMVCLCVGEKRAAWTTSIVIGKRAHLRFVLWRSGPIRFTLLSVVNKHRTLRQREGRSAVSVQYGTVAVQWMCRGGPWQEDYFSFSCVWQPRRRLFAPDFVFDERESPSNQDSKNVIQ